MKGVDDAVITQNKIRCDINAVSSIPDSPG